FGDAIEHRKTLAPPGAPLTAPPPEAYAPLGTPDAPHERSAAVSFPEAGAISLHPSGVALVHTAEVGFAARLEAVRASSNGLGMAVLERHAKGKPTGETFGGAATPVVHAAGEGHLVLGARAGWKVSTFALAD